MPQTLLLADDSVTIQRVIELTFADEDIKVVAVSDGDQAIERIEAEPPDIVLVDIGMPGRSGYEVAQHIKQSPRLKHIPVLLLTGAFEPVDQARAVAAGCDGVLAKPFEPQLVIARVKELLGLGRDAPAAALEPPAACRAEKPTDSTHSGKSRPLRDRKWRVSTTILTSSTPRSRRSIPTRRPIRRTLPDRPRQSRTASTGLAERRRPPRRRLICHWRRRRRFGRPCRSPRR